MVSSGMSWNGGKRKSDSEERPDKWEFVVSFQRGVRMANGPHQLSQVFVEIMSIILSIGNVFRNSAVSKLKN